MKEKGIKITLLALAAVLITVGILNGGFSDTYNKGIRVCLECVGIG